MTDEIDYRKGRNLSALSFLIIVYILSGAELQDQGMMLGVVLQIEHTEYVTYAVIALFGFSAYQFGIEMAKPNHRTTQRIYDYLCNDKPLRNHIVSRAQERLDRATTKKQVAELVGKEPRNVSDKRVASWSPPTRDRATMDRKRPTTTRSLNRVTATAKATEKEPGRTIGEFEVDLDPVFYYRRELRALFLSVFYHPEAWEDMFPPILALVAYILIIHRWIYP